MNTSRHQHAIRVNGESVDDGVVARQVLDEVAIWEHPLLDVISRTRGKRVSVNKITCYYKHLQTPYGLNSLLFLITQQGLSFYY